MGLKDSGIAAEFGLVSLTVPRRLWKPKKVAAAKQRSVCAFYLRIPLPRYQCRCRRNCAVSATSPIHSCTDKGYRQAHRAASSLLSGPNHKVGPSGQDANTTTTTSPSANPGARTAHSCSQGINATARSPGPCRARFRVRSLQSVCSCYWRQLGPCSSMEPTVICPTAACTSSRRTTSTSCPSGPDGPPTGPSAHTRRATAGTRSIGITAYSRGRSPRPCSCQGWSTRSDSANLCLGGVKAEARRCKARCDWRKCSCNCCWTRERQLSSQTCSKAQAEEAKGTQGVEDNTEEGQQEGWSRASHTCSTYRLLTVIRSVLELSAGILCILARAVGHCCCLDFYLWTTLIKIKIADERCKVQQLGGCQ